MPTDQLLTAAEWIQLMFLGGLAGTLGQGTRVVVGMKKLDAEAVAAGKERKDLMEVSRLLISIAIGFIAGALAALLTDVDLSKIQVEQILAFAAAGYAGADFIEGAMSRFVPVAQKEPGSGQTSQPGTASGSAKPGSVTVD